jgi:hypothetical protein
LIAIEELKKNFLQVRIDYWKTVEPQDHLTKKMVKELELIQIIIGKPTSPVSTKQSDHDK